VGGGGCSARTRPGSTPSVEARRAATGASQASAASAAAAAERAGGGEEWRRVARAGSAPSVAPISGRCASSCVNGVRVRDYTVSVGGCRRVRGANGCKVVRRTQSTPPCIQGGAGRRDTTHEPAKPHHAQQLNFVCVCWSVGMRGSRNVRVGESSASEKQADGRITHVSKPLPRWFRLDPISRMSA